MFGYQRIPDMGRAGVKLGDSLRHTSELEIIHTETLAAVMLYNFMNTLSPNETDTNILKPLEPSKNDSSNAILNGKQLSEWTLDDLLQLIDSFLKKYFYKYERRSSIQKDSKRDDVLAHTIQAVRFGFRIHSHHQAVRREDGDTIVDSWYRNFPSTFPSPLIEQSDFCFDYHFIQFFQQWVPLDIEELRHTSC